MKEEILAKRREREQRRTLFGKIRLNFSSRSTLLIKTNETKKEFHENVDLARYLLLESCGQSFKQFTLVIYNCRGVL